MRSTSPTNYQSIDMPHEGEAVLWKKFYVHEAGKTNGAHLSLVNKLKGIGHIPVDSSAVCDYVLVICPAVSRVGTNIGEALDSMPADKPAILVVMHHTFNNKHVVAESKRQVSHPNVYLTVDFLFHEGKLLRDCTRNDIAWFDIHKFLKGPNSQVSRWNFLDRIPIWNSLDVSTKWIIGGVTAGVVLVTLVITLIVYLDRKNI